MELTPDGETLLRYCNTILALEGETLARINGAGSTSEARLCISGPTSIMRARIIPKCLTIMAKYQQLLITFDINDSEHRIHSLQRGVSQFAIVEPEYISKEMEMKLLVSEKYVLLCNPSWLDSRLVGMTVSENVVYEGYCYKKC